jgi:hypothetical protein
VRISTIVDGKEGHDAIGDAPVQIVVGDLDGLGDS